MMFDMNSFIEEMKKSQKQKANECESKCSKYCIIFEFDMGKVNNKYTCKACYNCATWKGENKNG